MKCLSLKQPWASMIARGEKTIETRTWGTNYKGPLLIAASKKPDLGKGYPTGCVIAVTTLVGCRPMLASDFREAGCHVYPGAVSWILINTVALKPFPVKGQLGLFEVDFEMPEYVPGTLERIESPGC